MRYLILGLLTLLTSWNSHELAAQPFRPGEPLKRAGDEIVVCGQLFHTGTPVVLWTDPGGYDAYRVERRFVPLDQAGWKETEKAGAIKSPNRYSTRTRGLSAGKLEEVRGGGWRLEDLQKSVDQFVIHFDARGTSKLCYQVLHDMRGLSVHFMLDVDGTIYQTLDLKESAWHATKANGRSIGIEIANVGAYDKGGKNPLATWYGKDKDGKTVMTIPGGAAKAGVREHTSPIRPDRDQLIIGEVQGKMLEQYDLTPQQYASLAKLTATLTQVFPKIKLDYPRDGAGKLVLKKLPDDVYDKYQGVLGHYHVQSNKVDPGPAFQWDRLIRDSKALLYVNQPLAR